MSTTIKTCGDCGHKLPVTMFYKHPKTKDGLQGKCKECCKRYTTERRRLTSYKSQRKYERKAREKRRKYNSANLAVHRAVREGRLVREPCFMCGSEENIHGHHADYSKPLDVIWLCCKCHRRIHAYEDRVQQIKGTP